jgi:hypothetical protein
MYSYGITDLNGSVYSTCSICLTSDPSKLRFNLCFLFIIVSTVDRIVPQEALSKCRENSRCSAQWCWKQNCRGSEGKLTILSTDKILSIKCSSLCETISQRARKRMNGLKFILKELIAETADWSVEQVQSVKYISRCND